MKILGISAFYHDSSATIINDGKIIAAVQEERFTRIKHDPSFPINSIKFCLEYSGLEINKLDAIVFYDKPFLKFERLLETYYNSAPKGIKSFITSIPVWLKEKIFIKEIINKELSKIDKIGTKKKIILFPEHHLSHAASAFYVSPFKESAILTVDGVGEWATSSISIGHNNRIKILKELHFPHSLGLFYSAFTYWLGFRVNSGEYKLMGLAPYGNPYSKQVYDYKERIKKEIVKINSDGSIRLNQSYFKYTTDLRMIDERKWQDIFKFSKREPESSIEQHHCNLALAIQQVTEEIILMMAQEAKRLTNSENLCLAGGVALNCVANSKILNEKLFKNIFIQPAAGDAGGSLGAALAAHYIYFEKERKVCSGKDQMQGSFLGPEFSNLSIEILARRYDAKFNLINNFDKLIDIVSDLIIEGKIIGWFQGKMEFGPRALGNRSILADARNSEIQKKLNLSIKFRESFRPFAPSILAEDINLFFDTKYLSPYMLLTANLKEKFRSELPDNYHDLSILDKLYFNRSRIPAITHVDFSARVQTVSKETNERFWNLIYKFKEKTGYGIMVNTSFNVRGEPIVCSPEDAYKCFISTDMDYLVMNDYLFTKSDQPKIKPLIQKDTFLE